MQAKAPNIPPGSVDGDFLVQDLKRFATITNSTSLQSFAYLGNKALDLGTTKGRSRLTPVNTALSSDNVALCSNGSKIPSTEIEK